MTPTVYPRTLYFVTFSTYVKFAGDQWILSDPCYRIQRVFYHSAKRKALKMRHSFGMFRTYQSVGFKHVLMISIIDMLQINHGKLRVLLAISKW
jgi:hypothetical protein